MATNRFVLFAFLVFVSLCPAFGQEQMFVLKGRIVGPDQQSLPGVNIMVKNSKEGTFSDQNGRFYIKLRLHKDSVLIFSMLNYQTVERRIVSGLEMEIVQVLNPTSIRLGEVEISKERVNNSSGMNIDALLTKNLSGVGGGAVEQLVKTMPGVSSHNELSTQYNVRGGNYDENLLYVNGIEIFRPFLVKTGEQEGLSFLNPDLVSSIRFSSGGFESSYGDKMSSVLDINYKAPDKNAGSAELGALGGSIHLEGRTFQNKFTYLTGLRYRDNRYLLGTLDQKGHYDPSCFDFQTLLGFNFSPKFSINLLADLATNNYSFTPETRETRFGTMSQAYLLKIYFEGKEKDQFANRFAAFTANYQASPTLNLKWNASAFYSDEKERYDILGQYYLNEIMAGANPGANPDSSLLIGVGSSLKHAGNFLRATLLSLEHTGNLSTEQHNIRWGIKLQSERIHDQVGEWEMRDSAGYSLPYNDQKVELYRSVKADNQINSLRFSAFVQDELTTRIQNSALSVNYGGRIQYWNFNRQTIFSPRILVRYFPTWNKSLQLHAAWGIYQQMPFFKELKNLNAEIVTAVQAQKSIHYLVGLDYPFVWGNRPFKFSTEIWYKALTNLIPYKVTNLDLQYFPEQKSKGYATGLEMKVFGEPIPGATSWASVTLMKTEEDIIGDHYQQAGVNGAPTTTVYPGYTPRPTDQRFNFSMFFQDFLPKNPTVKMNLTLLYGSRLPFGPPQAERYMDTFRMPAYKRVDIGFSKMLLGGKNSKSSNAFGRNLKEAWLSLEIFNLFDLNNTISYYWVSDFENQMHAVPNYLTGRRINLKASIIF